MARSASASVGSLRGMVFDIQRFSVHDGPGIRATVFLKGCPLCCVWCQNPESQQMKAELLQYVTRCIHCLECMRICEVKAIEVKNGIPSIRRERCTSCGRCAQACPADALKLSGKRMSVLEVMREVQKDRAFYQMSAGGVTISGGEPLRQSRFLVELLRACKTRQLHTVLETSGYGAWSTFRRILPYVDLFLYDVKIIDLDEHRKLTGVSNEIIIDNLHKLSASGKTVQVRTPLIPGLTTSHANLAAIARLLHAVGISEIELLPYNLLAGDKYGKLGRKYGLQGIEYLGEIKKEAEKLFRDCSICTR